MWCCEVCENCGGLLLPFVLGAGFMAFVLNVPMAFIERHVFGKAKEKEDRRDVQQQNLQDW